jgi:hypothetical protein
MSADVVPLAPERKPPKMTVVVGVVNADPVGVRSLNPRDLAIERCADQIAHAMSGLTLEQRIGLERAPGELVDEIAWHSREHFGRPW